jgi:CP family cyanate transporter-like MFS transporter
MLSIAWVMAFSMVVPIYCVPPMEHILKAELLLSHSQTILLYSIPLMMVSAVAIPSGLLCDRIGIKKAAGIGAIIVAVGAVLRGTAGDVNSLIAATFVYGVGLGWLFPNLPKLVSGCVPREKAGMATGIFSTGLLAGIAIPMAITMPTIFPLTNTFQGVFLVWSIPPVAAAILWWAAVREPRYDMGERRPIRWQVLKNKTLWQVAILFLLHDFYFGTWLGWSPTLIILKGGTPDLAGLIASVTVWVSIPTVLLMPRLAYRIGLRKPFLWVPGILAALIAFLAIRISLSLSWLVMVLVGIVLETRFVTIMALPVELVPREDVGTASGLVLAVGFAGGVIGSFVSGHLLDLLGSLDLALIMLAAVSLAATFIALRLPETGNKAKRTSIPNR